MIWWPFNRNLAKQDDKDESINPPEGEGEEDVDVNGEEATEEDMAESAQQQQKFFTGDLPKVVTSDPTVMALITRQNECAKVFYDEIDNNIQQLRNVRLALKRKRRRAK